MQQILGDLLSAEVAEKQARSISYQIGAAKLPLAKELTEFEFTGSPVNEALVCDLHGGDFSRHSAMSYSSGNRHRQKPSIDRHHRQLHTQAKRSGALLQRRRPGQPSGGRGSRRRRRQAGRATHPR